MVTTVTINRVEYEVIVNRAMFFAVAQEKHRHTSMDSTTKYYFRDQSSTFVYSNKWQDKIVVSVYDKQGLTIARMEYYPHRIN